MCLFISDFAIMVSGGKFVPQNATAARTVDELRSIWLRSPECKAMIADIEQVRTIVFEPTVFKTELATTTSQQFVALLHRFVLKMIRDRRTTATLVLRSLIVGLLIGES
jgi:hypothetical protein